MRRELLAGAFVILGLAQAHAQPAPADAGVVAPASPDATPTQTDAATAPPSVAPAVAPAEAAAPDVDLSSLGLDPAGPDDKLNISGFADISWRALLNPATDLAASFYPKESTFLVGHVNVYITKNLSRRWRSLLEIRYLAAPAGTTNPDGTFVHAVAPDPADYERPISWSGLSIERVYLEYEVNDSFTVQAGTFLTPYGIWNVDHGSPAIIPVTRPFVIGDGLFPQQQTGIHVYGKHAFGEYALTYHATLTNGRGPFQSFRDLDNNKALGARLELTTPWLDGVQIGISGYRGRFTDRPADVVAVDPSGNLVNTTPLGVSYDELAFGADVLIRRGPLHIQGELLGNDRAYRVGARELARGGFLNDGRSFGGYVLTGYRYNGLWQVMPFIELEAERFRDGPNLGAKPNAFQAGAGLNFRPDPSVVLKLEFIQGFIESSIRDFQIREITTQAAWAF